MGAIGITLAAAALTRKTEPALSMHEDDWEEGYVPIQGRRYRSLGHFLHHQRELVRVLGPIARVYVAGSIDTALREQVMIVTAISNACSP